MGRPHGRGRGRGRGRDCGGVGPAVGHPSSRQQDVPCYCRVRHRSLSLKKSLKTIHRTTRLSGGPCGRCSRLAIVSVEFVQ